MNEKYQNIINIPHHYSKNHRPMSRLNRAAQFAPFSALTGYNEAIIEEGREVEQKKELTEYEKDMINSKLNFLIENQINDKISIIYFVKDNKKVGGKYEKIVSSIKKIDEINQKIILINRKSLDINDILSIEGEAFSSFYD